MLWLKRCWQNIQNYQLITGLIIILTVMFVMSIQVYDRTEFANTELHTDVMERWGRPISQASPSIRYIKTGSVFTSLDKLPLTSQAINFDAKMNYRKRGLVYFSGFDFDFKAHYSIENDQQEDIDIVFVFPVNLEKNRVLLKDFKFMVNERAAQIDRSENANKLVWTGRLKVGQVMTFRVAYSGRGLDKFVYQLDPSMQVKNFKMQASITGGDNYDYPSGVVPASVVNITEDENISLNWGYQALESGVPIGVILPSQKSYSSIIATMIRRALVTFLLFLVAIHLLARFYKQSLSALQSCLVYSSFAFFYVLLPYLTAFMSFHIAYLCSIGITSLFLYFFIFRIVNLKAANLTLALLLSFLVIPTCAVILQGFTGLIYTLEILVGLGVLMWLVSSNNQANKVAEVIKGAALSDQDMHQIENQLAAIVQETKGKESKEEKS